MCCVVAEKLEPRELVSICGELLPLRVRIRTGALLDNVRFFECLEHSMKTSVLLLTNDYLNEFLSRGFGTLFGSIGKSLPQTR